VEIDLKEFEALVALISSVGGEAKQKHPPALVRYRRKEITRSTVSATGLVVTEYRNEESYKPSWHKAKFALLEELKRHPDSMGLTGEIKRDLGSIKNADGMLFQAINALVDDFFADRRRDLLEFVRILRKDFGGEPVNAWTDIELHGFAIEVPKIEFELAQNEFSFRQVEVSDFEKEVPDYAVRPFGIWSEPSSLLRISTMATMPIDLQFEKSHAEAALRLFTASPIKCPTQSMHSESITRMFAGTMSLGMTLPTQPFRLKPGDVASFKTFWLECYGKIPAGFYSFSTEQEDFLKIAYDRYTDGILHQGRIEGKIAFAIMGLEAIFLRGEKDELRYRLSLRIAKVFSKLGVSIEGIQRRVRTGYDIRSIYVHGGHLNSSQRAKHEKDLNLAIPALSNVLLNDLRISLLFFILTKMEKTKLLDIIEASFLSAPADQEIQTIVDSCKHILRPHT
jgi:hypothetical protein